MILWLQESSELNKAQHSSTESKEEIETQAVENRQFWQSASNRLGPCGSPVDTLFRFVSRFNNLADSDDPTRCLSNGSTSTISTTFSSLQFPDTHKRLLWTRPTSCYCGRRSDSLRQFYPELNLMRSGNSGILRASGFARG